MRKALEKSMMEANLMDKKAFIPLKKSENQQNNQ
jgi:hypothetical protein